MRRKALLTGIIALLLTVLAVRVAVMLELLIDIPAFTLGSWNIDISAPSNGLLATYGLILITVLSGTFLIVFLKYKDPYEVAMDELDPAARNYPLVSCLVAVKDEEVMIRTCVESMLAQTYPNKEIIVVDDASTDRTGEILDEMTAEHPIRVIHMPENVGKKKALAKALREARGEIFAFTDSDSVWAPDAIERVAAILEHRPDVGAVSGHCRALNARENTVTRMQDAWYEGQFRIRKGFESVFGAVTCVSGPLAVYRRAAVYNFIPAWENDTFMGEQFKFATDRTMTGFVLGGQQLGPMLRERYADSPFVSEEQYPDRNWKVVYSKSARAWTIVPDTTRKMIRQQIRWKKSFIRNIFFTGKFYWRRPFIPALFYYLHILIVLVGPFIVTIHLLYLPLKGNLLYIVPYILAVTFIGLLFGLAYKLEHRKDNRWIFRPLMSLFSTFILSWLLFYSAATIRRMNWFR